MPTTIPVVSSTAVAPASNLTNVREHVLAVLHDPDFITIATFVLFGLLVAMLLTAYRPLSVDPIALLNGAS